MRVGNTSHSVDVPVIVNTKSLSNGDEVIVQAKGKRPAEEALDAPPAKEAKGRWNKGKGGKGKGKAK